MNRLKKDSLFGMYPEWNDWDWTQDAIQDALKQILSQWGIDNASYYILWGCEANLNAQTDEYEISEGAVVLDGEPLRVPAHTVPQHANDGGFELGEGYWYKVSVTYDPSGNEPTEDGSNIDAYQIRTAEAEYDDMSAVAPGGGTTLQDALNINGPRLNEIIAEQTVNHLPEMATDTTEATMLNGHEHGANPVKYRLDSFGYLELEGEIASNDATDQYALRLPTTPNMRPDRIVQFFAVKQDGSPVRCYIVESGYVAVTEIGSQGDYIDLTGVRLRLRY